MASMRPNTSATDNGCGLPSPGRPSGRRGSAAPRSMPCLIVLPFISPNRGVAGIVAPDDVARAVPSTSAAAASHPKEPPENLRNGSGGLDQSAQVLELEQHGERALQLAVEVHL